MSKQYFKKFSHELFESKFSLGKILGSGSFATVMEGLERRENKLYAIKLVHKCNLDEYDEIDLLDEIDILQSLDHQNIIKLFSVYNEIKSYNLVLELVRGGELLERIVLRHQYTEKDARDVCKILFDAIGYCHEKKIVHRDLKPENLILLDEENDSKLKIADFGFARRLTVSNGLRTQCGSPNFVAPEIIRGKRYGEKVDMWSIGVILYLLLCGYLPFTSSKYKILYQRIVKGDYEFQDKDWNGVSEDAKNLISSLLQIDPTKRISAADALQLQWMKKEEENLKKFDRNSSLENLKIFQITNKFRAATNIVISVNNLSSAMRKKNSISVDELEGLEDIDLGPVTITSQCA